MNFKFLIAVTVTSLVLLHCVPVVECILESCRDSTGTCVTPGACTRKGSYIDGGCDRPRQ
ncbi:hypothetical protein Bhyg_06948, partial [Pseudolycoriella hygida]